MRVMLAFNRQARRFSLRRHLSRAEATVVITGFNTDIEHDGVVYHVQTEDKGMKRPVIVSLVYNGGTILASKRSPYEDLLKANFSETALAERLNKQHRLICAAVQAGRIDDLRKMTARETAARNQPAVPAEAPPVPAPSEALLSRDPSIAEPRPSKPEAASLVEFNERESPIPKPAASATDAIDDIGLIDEPIIDAVTIIEDDILLIPDDAVEIIGEPAFIERPGHNKLCIEILGDARFKGGERKTVSFMVSRGTSRKVVSGAEIMVKILGSSFRPVIFHALTDENGVAAINLQLPSFTTGRAAFLVRAINGGEETEVRRSIAHGQHSFI